MTIEELKQKILDFRNLVNQYNQLLLRSRDPIIPKIVRNYDQIESMRSKLNKKFGALEKYIRKLGKNPKMSDGVWDVFYSVYENAFSSDVLVRVGPSLNTVLQDLDYVLGKLEEITEKEFQEIINSPKPKEILFTEGIKEKKKINYWNFVNPFWLFWRLLVLAWKYKIISGIIISLIVAYLSFKFGWK